MAQRHWQVGLHQAGMRYAVSFTLTCLNGHTDVPFQWFDKLGEFTHVFCHRAMIRLERGGVRRVLHVQAVLEIGLDYPRRHHQDSVLSQGEDSEALRPSGGQSHDQGDRARPEFRT